MYFIPKIANPITKEAQLILHGLGLIASVGYGFYHCFSDNFIVGAFALLAALSGCFSLWQVINDKDNFYSYLLFLLLLGFALCLTSYFYHYRGLIFIFPYTASLFYLLKFRLALGCAVGVSVICLIAALNSAEPVLVWRYTAALIMSIAFSASYAYVMSQQRLALENDANRDHLTGVTNRRQFSQWLDSVVSGRQYDLQSITLFYIDIDDFKKINDNHSHALGDALLKAFSERMLAVVRQDDIIQRDKKVYNFARLAGDEFILAIINIDDNNSAKKIAQRLVSNASLPFNLLSTELTINISLGVASSGSEINAEALLHNADIAMYRSKKSGKNSLYIYDESISLEINQEKDIEKNITQALKDNGFELVYMPIYDMLNDNKVVGLEALLRCFDETLQLPEPEKFIPIAEASGLIRDIDYWVMDKMFSTLNGLDKESDLYSLWYCINVSSVELLDSRFVDKAKYLLGKYKIDPKKIHLEITETKLVPYEDIVVERLQELKNLGFYLTLDDYGTGYTGFSQLLHFPGDSIKIDRSFICHIADSDEKYKKIIEMMSSIAKICDLKLVAEGVETQEQLDYITSVGCQYVQGYYFSKLLTWNELKLVTLK